MRAQFLNVTKRKFIMMIIGNLLLGLGVSMFRYSKMGNDPFSGMIFIAAGHLNLSYSFFLVIFNTAIFLVELYFARQLVGIGTVVNWFLVGYVVQLCLWFMQTMLPTDPNIALRVLFVSSAVLIMSLGISLYQTSNVGISPYDSLALILDKRLPLPFFWCRMICDGSCALICFFLGGMIGLGTFLCAFCLGPVIHFFNKNLSEKLLAETFDTSMKPLK